MCKMLCNQLPLFAAKSPNILIDLYNDKVSWCLNLSWKKEYTPHLTESVEMNKDKYNLHTLPQCLSVKVLTPPKVDAYVKIDVGFQNEITIFKSAARYKSL